MEANWAWMKRNTRGGVSMVSDPLKAPENPRGTPSDSITKEPRGP